MEALRSAFDGGHPHGLAEVASQRPHAIAIEPEHPATLEQQRLGEHARIRMRIPVLVAAHPGAEPDQRPRRQRDRRVLPAEGRLQVFDQVGHRLKEGPLQVKDRVGHLVEDTRPHRAHFVGVPEHLNVRRHPGVGRAPGLEL